MTIIIIITIIRTINCTEVIFRWKFNITRTKISSRALFLWYIWREEKSALYYTSNDIITHALLYQPWNSKAGITNIGCSEEMIYYEEGNMIKRFNRHITQWKCKFLLLSNLKLWPPAQIWSDSVLCTERTDISINLFF